MRALYESGAQSQLRLLLNQDEANTLSRNIQYSEYLFAARREKMQVYVDAIKQLSELEEETRAAIAELQATQAALEQEQAQLITQQEERKKIAHDADADLKAKGGELKKLEQNRASLQKLVDQIEKQRALAQAQEEKRKQDESIRAQQEQERLLAEQAKQAAQAAQQAEQAQIAQQEAQEAEKQSLENQPEETAPATPKEPTAAPEKKSAPAYSAEDLARLQEKTFAQRKGSMLWPVQGSVINSFGAQRQGSVTWDGLRIKANNGTEVRAIHGGRVMYADSLPGQGLLLVLDHGDGFMSLYAHNDALLREAGEWVQPGDSIASVGNSGGEKEPGLYFEIRQNGQPINPQPWLSKR